MDADEPDPGRLKVTGVEADTGAFKTPTMRDITRSAPYFHDGSVATLDEAVDAMLGGGWENPYLDSENLKPVELTDEQTADLLAFLETLEMEDRLEQPDAQALGRRSHRLQLGSCPLEELRNVCGQPRLRGSMVE